jgi:hypothetical protein
MMNRFGVALLAVPLLALPVAANDDPFAPCLPFRVETGVNFHFRVLSQDNGWGAQLGPWYNYWPMEAHFQTPAIPNYPYWPAPQAILPGGTSTAIPAPLPPHAVPTAAPAAAAPAPTPTNAPRPVYFRPVGYYPAGYYSYPQQAPVWWYGQR